MPFRIAENIRKAVWADRYYIRGSDLYSSIWTPQLDQRLVQLCAESNFNQICREMKIHHRTVRARLKFLGLSPMGLREVKTPTPGEWIGAVNRKAAEAGLSPIPILAGKAHRTACSVRWRAWAAILDENPEYSIAGVARASGHDHTSLLWGLKKLGWKRQS